MPAQPVGVYAVTPPFPHPDERLVFLSLTTNPRSPMFPNTSHLEALAAYAMAFVAGAMTATSA